MNTAMFITISFQSLGLFGLAISLPPQRRNRKEEITGHVRKVLGASVFNITTTNVG